MLKMNWDLNNTGINPTPFKIYSSPYSTADSKLALGGSKLNHAVAEHEMSTDQIAKQMILQAEPIPDKNHSLRYQLNANDLTNFKLGASIEKQENYDPKRKIRNLLRKGEEFRRPGHVPHHYGIRGRFEKFGGEKKSVVLIIVIIISLLLVGGLVTWFIIRNKKKTAKNTKNTTFGRP